MKIDFQLFGNNTDSTTDTVDTQDNNTVDTQETYTADEVQKLIDSQISKAYVKWEKQQTKAVKEAERLASLSEEERSKERIKQLEETLAQREKDIAVRENTITLQAEMGKRNIPVEFTNFLVSDDADTMFENLKTFETGLKKLVNSEVEKRISSTVPKSGNTVDTNALTKEKFKNMSLAEQQALYNTDRELYNTLTK